MESDDDSVLDALQRDLVGDVGPRSNFENDASRSFHSAQRGSHMWGKWLASMGRFSGAPLHGENVPRTRRSTPKSAVGLGWGGGGQMV